MKGGATFAQAPPKSQTARSIGQGMRNSWSLFGEPGTFVPDALQG